MTNDEMQRTMDFILEMNAKSSATIDALIQAEKQAQTAREERWKRADERWAVTEARIFRLLAVARKNERLFFDRLYQEHKRNYRRK